MDEVINETVERLWRHLDLCGDDDQAPIDNRWPIGLRFCDLRVILDRIKDQSHDD